MRLVLGALALVTVVACSAPVNSAPQSPGAARIVSLLPSFTEDLCALGAGGRLAGVSAFSNDIACARGLPVVNDFASVDDEAIVRLHPDSVVGIPAQRALTEPLRRAGIRVIFLRNDTYGDLFTDIDRLGALTDRRPQARELIDRLRRRTAALRAGEHFRRAPRVFFVAQAVPIWTAGASSYIATLVTLSGARLATNDLTQPYAQYSPEALVRTDPDALVATSDAHLGAVLGSEPWRSLRAVREHHVYVLQNAALLVRPGPRYNEGLSWLIERLRPLGR